MNNLKINHLAVFVCLVLMHGLGFLWFGPLFGEKWMALVDLDIAAMQEDSSEIGLWVTNFIAVLAPLYFLAWLFTKLDVRSGVRGAILAFLISFCFHHLPLMSGNMFAGEHYGLAWIVGGYNLLGLAICGFILGAWTKSGS
ncbi:MAG TPA: DUF1761 domain-containing protein [Chryseosolibacter sp.]|nr:DUF1761 domain-containing protein [Chryseosolibacter sp.]